MTLALDAISVSYGSLKALDDVSADAQAGRVTAVIGPNAAGKSTLLRCAAGVQQTDGGRITHDGEDVGSMSSADRAARMAYMAQRPRADVPLSVEELISLARVRLAPDPAGLESLIASLELEHIRSRPFPALSVGQQQRVSLARVLHQLGDRGVLVLDEPTAPMDPRHAATALAHIRAAASRGVVVLVSIHDLGLAGTIADDVWLLGDGQLVSSGPASEVMEPGQLQGVFGIDYERLNRSDGTSWLVPAPERV